MFSINCALRRKLFKSNGLQRGVNALFLTTCAVHRVPVASGLASDFLQGRMSTGPLRLKIDAYFKELEPPENSPEALDTKPNLAA